MRFIVADVDLLTGSALRFQKLFGLEAISPKLRDGSRASLGNVELAFNVGDDPRAVWEIPEVRVLARNISISVPHFPMFLTSTPAGLWLYFACLVPAESIGRDGQGRYVTSEDAHLIREMASAFYGILVASEHTDIDGPACAASMLALISPVPRQAVAVLTERMIRAGSSHPSTTRNDLSKDPTYAQLASSENYSALTEEELKDRLRRLSAEPDVLRINIERGDLVRLTRELHPHLLDYAQTMLAMALGRLNDHESALEALEVREAASLEGKSVVACILAGSSLLALSRFDDAWYAAEGARTRATGPYEKIISLRLESQLHDRQRRFSQAIKLIDEALEIRGAEPRSENEAFVLDLPSRTELLILRARSLVADLQFEAALSDLQSGFEHASAVNDRLSMASCLSESGSLWNRLGEKERGRRAMRDAGVLALELGKLDLAAIWAPQLLVRRPSIWELSDQAKLSIAAFLLEGGAPDLDYVRGLVDSVLRKDGLAPLVHRQAIQLTAKCYSHAGDHNQAAIIFINDANDAEKAGDPLRAFVSNVEAARCYWNTMQWSAAVKFSEVALKHYEHVIRMASTSEIRQSIRACIETAFDLLVTENCTNPSPDVIRAAGFVSRSRSRNISRWLGAAVWSESSNKRSRMVRSIIAAALDGEALSDLSSFGPGTPARRKGRRMPQRHGWRPAPESIFEVQRYLKPREMAIDLHATDQGIAGFAISHDRIALFFEEWKRPDRRRDAVRIQCGRRLAEAIDQPPRRGSQRKEPDITQDSMRLSETDTPLYGALSKILDDYYDHVIFASSAELAFLSLWDLPTSASISRVPTLDIIATWRQDRAPIGSGSIKIGDATGSLPNVSHELKLLESFVEIPAEIEQICEHVSGKRRLHFAGHCTFDSSSPYTSGIVLFGNNELSSHMIPEHQYNCSRLTIPGIVARLDLTGCETVFINACSGGVPREHAANEMTSVATAFLLSGTRNVVAASWPISDAAATVFAKYFYEFLDSGSSHAESLLLARRKLRNTSWDDAERLVAPGGLLGLTRADYPFQSRECLDAYQHYGVD